MGSLSASSSGETTGPAAEEAGELSELLVQAAVVRRTAALSARMEMREVCARWTVMFGETPSARNEQRAGAT
jgi:hypothetical protein